MSDPRTTQIVLVGFSWPMVAALLAVSVAIVWFTYRALRQGAGRRQLAALLAMRVLALLGVAFALLEPQAVLSRAEEIRQRVVLLLDGSMSMDLPSGVGGKTRQGVVREALSSTGELIRSLQDHFELHCMEFGGEAREGPVVMLDRLGSAGLAHTDIVDALCAAVREHGGEGLKAVLMVSDGADTELPDERDARRRGAAAAAEELKVPIFAFCPVRQSGLKDVAISRVDSARVAFTAMQWRAQVHLTVLGYVEGNLTVLLRRGDNAVQMQRVAIEPGRADYAVPLAFTPSQIGPMLLSVEVEPQPGEQYRSNNRAGIALSVVRDKLRVLQVAGRPSWDVRFLRRMLEQTPTVDLVSFFILRDMADDPGGATEHSHVNLIPFPTEELFTREIATFDVIIFQNFDYAFLLPFAETLGGMLSQVERHVREDGAGFVMVGGEQSFDCGHYIGTPVEGLLPVSLGAGERTVDEGEFRARLTPEGRRHAITRIEGDEAQNAVLWGVMPELSGCHVLPGVREGAVVLLEHPAIQHAGRGVPIVAVGRAGRGRTLAVATDETWKWGFLTAGKGLGNRLYLEFWRNALEWLAREPGTEGIRVEVGRGALQPGEEVRGSVRLLDSTYAPRPRASVDLRVFQGGEGRQPAFHQRLTTDGEGSAEFQFTPQAAGTYLVDARAAAEEGAEGEAPAATAFVSAELPQREVGDLRPDVDLLKWLAEDSGGRFYDIAAERSPAELPLRPGRVERLVWREMRPLWSNWLTYGLVVGLLCMEWWVRRRRGIG